MGRRRATAGMGRGEVQDAYQTAAVRAGTLPPHPPSAVPPNPHIPVVPAPEVAATPPAEGPPSRAKERRALWLMTASSVAFGIMAFCAKVASRGGTGGAEVAAIRFACGLLPLVVPRVRRSALTWQRRDLLLYRGLFGGTAVLLYFLTIDHVTVGLATLLNYMSPLFS